MTTESLALLSTKMQSSGKNKLLRCYLKVQLGTIKNTRVLWFVSITYSEVQSQDDECVCVSV